MKYLIMFSLFVLSGCAMTYKPPTANPTNLASEVRGTKSELTKLSRQTLVFEGYQITNSDESSGTISTAFKSLKVTPVQADCGTTMGIDYLKDNRTSTRVSYGLIVDDNKIMVKTNIEGEYKPGSVSQDMTLTCISRGLLERDLLEKIKRALQESNKAKE